ncbi:UNVERIFIED_CONTAM: hypothetical protein Sangu_1542300 [Sesamum angustifolium]|uniref:Uncharacterized protein n=1 Tax=Sesamum angustifolium TaxID=2727405 RepID=A0AAW2MTP0_9LAMI
MTCRREASTIRHMMLSELKLSGKHWTSAISRLSLRSQNFGKWGAQNCIGSKDDGTANIQHPADRLPSPLVHLFTNLCELE